MCYLSAENIVQFSRLYWVAVAYTTQEGYQWRKLGESHNLESDNVIYWANGTAPDALMCGAYNKQDRKLYGRKCTEQLPYICEYILEG